MTWHIDHLQCEDYLVKAQIAVAAGGRVSVAWASPAGVSHHWCDPSGEGSWQQEKVTSDPASHVEIAYDPENRLHVVYDKNGEPRRNHFRYDEKGALVYGIQTAAGSWKTETLADGLWYNSPGFNEDSHYPRLSKLVVDSSGRPHLAFSDLRFVHLAQRSDRGWAIQEVGRGHGHEDFALALDRAGRPHLLFRKPDGSQLACVHMWNESGDEDDWRTEPVVDSPGKGQHAEDKQLVVGPDGSLHAVLTDGVGTRDRALYLRRCDGRWSAPEQVEKKGNNGYGSALRVDHNATLHLVYRIHKSKRSASSIAAEPAKIRYAVRQGDTWRVEEVADGGWDCGLDVSPDGVPWIVFPSSFKYNSNEPATSLAVAHPRAYKKAS